MAGWRRLDSRRIARCGIFDLDAVRYEPPDRGAPRSVYVLAAPDWVNVIPLADDGTVLFVRQFRFGIAGETLEIPGGMCDAGEAPAEAARRELREETGYDAATIEELGWVHPNPPLQGNRCHTFLARGLRRLDTGGPDAREILEVLGVPLDEVPRLVAGRRITHALVLAAFHLLGCRSSG